MCYQCFSRCVFGLSICPLICHRSNLAVTVDLDLPTASMTGSSEQRVPARAQSLEPGTVDLLACASGDVSSSGKSSSTRASESQITVKTPSAASGRLGYTAFLTVILALTNTSGAALTILSGDFEDHSLLDLDHTIIVVFYRHKHAPFTDGCADRGRSVVPSHLHVLV